MKSDVMDRSYKKYNKEIYLYALSLCRDETIAEDLVSEAFFKAFIATNQPQVNDETFKYWLFRILKNHFIDLTRKQQESLTFDHLKKFTPNPSVTEPLSHYIKRTKTKIIQSFNAVRTDYL
jgi:RNA polymerase sigma-70 factor (ECF subfamily)